MDASPPEEERIEWTALPLSGRPWSRVFLAAILAGVTAAVWLQTDHAVMALAAAVFLAVTVSPALMPTRYTLDGAGVTVRHMGRTTRRPWVSFRRLIVDGDVVLLSPSARPCFLDTFRGQPLRFNPGSEDTRARAIRRCLDRLAASHAANSSGGPDGAPGHDAL